MKRHLFLLMLVFCLTPFACHLSKRTSVAKLDPAANIVVNGLDVTLQYNTSSQSNGFSITFSNVGNITCSNVSIETTSAYGIVPDSEVFIPSPVNSSMPQYSCTKSGNNIILTEAPPLSQSGFRPWVDDFTISIGKTVFTVMIDTTLIATQTLTRGPQTEMYLNSSFLGCGLNGTVLQRAYDCSKMITNYGATVTGNAAEAGTNAACGASDPNPSCSYYTAFTSGAVPDAYWFVVSCPNTNGSSTIPQQNCSWLTPVVTSNQPALDTAGTKTFTLNILTGYQKRLLFSGKLANDGNGYDFANANGLDANNPPVSTTAQTYDPTTANPGAGADGPQPTPTPTTICLAIAGETLNSTYHSGITFAATDAAVRNLISSSTGATIAWQMPSYPMLNILTGGTPTNGLAFCRATDGTTRPYCDEPNASTPNGSNMGFNAINVPGFSESNTVSHYEWLWSSSNSGVGGAWLFFPHSDFLDYGNWVDGEDPSVGLGARCVSPAWF